MKPNDFEASYRTFAASVQPWNSQTKSTFSRWIPWAKVPSSKYVSMPWILRRKSWSYRCILLAGLQQQEVTGTARMSRKWIEVGKDGYVATAYGPTNRDNGRGLMMGFRITMVDHFVGRSWPTVVPAYYCEYGGGVGFGGMGIYCALLWNNYEILWSDGEKIQIKTRNIQLKIKPPKDQRWCVIFGGKGKDWERWKQGEF